MSESTVSASSLGKTPRPFIDESTIQAAVSGDRTAFAELLDTHYDLIYRIAFSYIRDPDQAADITQDTCVKLARKLSSYRFDAKFSTWLYRLTINAAKDWQRKAHRKHEKSWPEDFDTVASTPTPERQTATRELLSMVESLPRKLRDTVVLVFRDGLTHGQAASALGCAETTVSWRIHEARKVLSPLISDVEEDRHHA